MYFQNKNGEVVPFTKTILADVFHVEELTSLEFSEEKIASKILQKTAKKLGKPQVQRTNDWTLTMYERDWKRGPFQELLIKLMNPLVGYGVYAFSTIPIYSYIGEYTGVVRKRKWRGDKLNDYIFGYMIGGKDTPWIIDAKEKGNFTRFFNHSLTPNITSRWIIVEGLCHVIFFANRKIDKGEQLTYDYGPYFWKKRSGPITI